MNFAVPTSLRAWREGLTRFARGRALSHWRAGEPVDAALLAEMESAGFGPDLIARRRWIAYAIGSLELAAAHPWAFLARGIEDLEAAAVAGALAAVDDEEAAKSIAGGGSALVAFMGSGGDPSVASGAVTEVGGLLHGEIPGLLIHGDPTHALVRAAPEGRSAPGFWDVHRIRIDDAGAGWPVTIPLGEEGWSVRTLGLEGARPAASSGDARGGAAALGAHLFDRWLRTAALAQGLCRKMLSPTDPFDPRIPDGPRAREGAELAVWIEAVRWQVMAAAWARETGEAHDLKAATAMVLGVEALSAAEALARGPGAGAGRDPRELARLRCLADLTRAEGPALALARELLRRGAGES